MNVQRYLPTVGVIILIFAFIDYLQMLIPTFSDDYFYFIMGNDFWGRAVSHYMSWSGRIVADAISSNMLAHLPKFIYSALNTAAFVLLVYLISSLPSIFTKKRDFLLPLTIILICGFYIIANPNFVETSMWVVGSANYLWTSLAIVSYFSFIAKIVSSSPLLTDVRCGIFVLLLSFVAGCTNESTGIIIPVFSMVMVIFYIPPGKKLFNIINIGVIGGLLGWLVLVLSPGNTARALNFTDWYAEPWLYRIGSYIYGRLPVGLSDLWPLLLAMVYLSMVPISTGQRKHSLWSVFFFFAALGSALAMAASPYVPPRAYNGTLVFLLISLSFIMHAPVTMWHSSTIRALYITPALFFCVSFLLPQMIMFKNDLELINEQETIRNNIIISAKKIGAKTVEIPEFITNPYIGKLSTGFPSNYELMAKYWGVNKIFPFTAKINYAHINHNDGELVINAKLTESIILEKIIFYTESLPFYMNKKNIALYQFNEDLSGLTTDGNIFFMHYNVGNSEPINADLGIINAVKFGRHWYVERQLSPEITPEKINSISFGLFDKVNLRRVSSIMHYIKHDA